MGPDPQLQRAVIDVMALRDDRVERRRGRTGDGRSAASPPAEPDGYSLEVLAAGVRALPGLALALARSTAERSGWRR